MQITKQSSSGNIKDNTNSYLLGVDNDLTNIFNVFKGRVRFGDANSGSNGENIQGQFQVFTSSSTVDTEFSVSHTVGAVPIGWLLVSKDKAGDLYKGDTEWTSDTVYFKSSVASVSYTIFLLK